MKFFRFLAPLLLVATAGAAGSIDVFHRQWTVPEPSDWNISGDGDAQVLTLQHARNPLPGPRRPIQFALTPTEPYRTLTLEADVQPWQLSLVIVFAYQDEAHFNYAHLSVDTGVKQPVHNGIFHVYGGERVRKGRSASSGRLLGVLQQQNSNSNCGAQKSGGSCVTSRKGSAASSVATAVGQRRSNANAMHEDAAE